MRSYHNYTRTYVRADPTGDASRRRFQVGDKVTFFFPYCKTPSEPRTAVVVSHDRYWVNDVNGPWSIKDSYYTVRFDKTGTTRSWVSSNWLQEV